jgi:alginate O-acetyltransferase complex protein AlgJ
MKKYAIKYALFFLPFIIAISMELFILPIDYFTFRAWEALSVRRSLGILKGPFYPNMFILKTEEGGDLAVHSSCALKKKDVIWITDKYGYRKANSTLKGFPIVVVGDSNLAGAGHTQKDMFSEVLELRLNKGVYPLAPESLKEIFSHGLLKQSPPEIIILESIERGILTGNYRISTKKDFGKFNYLDDILVKIRLNGFVQLVAIKLDRILKANMINYLRAGINRPAVSGNKSHDKTNCPILFLQGAVANNDVPAEKLNAVAQSIKKYSDFFTNKGIRFIFLPIPNKENIYYKNLGTKKPVFLKDLVKKLRELNVEVVDTQTTFSNLSERSIALYHRDDTHWNAEGVKVAAELLEEVIRKKPGYMSLK